MPRPSNPGLKDSPYQLQEEQLTLRDHLDPDKHWIGEALPAPSEEEIASTGTRTHVGDSPFPARADHAHELVLHHTCVGNTANYVYTTNPNVAYVNNLVNYGPEDWLEGGTTKVKLEYPGVYLIICHFQVQRSSGSAWAGTEYLDIKFSLNDASHVRRVYFSSLPAGRSIFKTVITDRWGTVTPPPANSNLQFGLASDDTTDLWVRISNAYIIRLASGDVPEEGEV